MTTTTIEKPAKRSSQFKNTLSLILIFAIIISCIFVFRRCSKQESEFVDSVAGQIEQEMAESKIVLSSKGGRRTVVDFKEPIILAHGQESRLIVHTVKLSETISVADEGLGGWGWTSAYQDIVYEGNVQYTVDLSQLSEEDFVVNNEMKTLTIRIPYAVLEPINIPSDKIKFGDVKKGWAAPKDIKLTPEENAKLEVQILDKMKAKLIDENILAEANESAKKVVAELLTATVHAVDPEFTVVVVQ